MLDTPSNPEQKLVEIIYKEQIKLRVQQIIKFGDIRELMGGYRNKIKSLKSEVITFQQLVDCLNSTPNPDEKFIIMMNELNQKIQQNQSNIITGIEGYNTLVEGINSCLSDLSIPLKCNKLNEDGDEITS